MQSVVNVGPRSQASPLLRLNSPINRTIEFPRILSSRILIDIAAIYKHGHPVDRQWCPGFVVGER